MSTDNSTVGSVNIVVAAEVTSGGGVASDGLRKVAAGLGFTGAGCFNCGGTDHVKSECDKPDKGICANCGLFGHKKTDCTNPTAEGVLADVICHNCGQEGHRVNECQNPRLIDRSKVQDLMPDQAWAQLTKAIVDRDLDDVREAIEIYMKALPKTTYTELESAFRTQGIDLYIVALDRELGSTYTSMDAQGNLDRKYAISYRFSYTPKRPKEREMWPDSYEDNLERLKDAGEPVDRLLTQCSNCKAMGHGASHCKEEKVEILDRVEVKCSNCNEIGHRMRDCPISRVDKFACRNCKASGHQSKECPEPRSAEGVECNKCHETGHFSRDCPTGGGSTCRNCGGEGHRAKECTEPRNPTTIQCRNCDEMGHMSKECPKPRDYSRVQCKNCSEMGHTRIRCKQPPKEEDVDTAGSAAFGGDNEGNYGGDRGSPGGSVHTVGPSTPVSSSNLTGW